MKIQIFITLFCFFAFSASAQDEKVLQLKKKIAACKNDSLKIDLLKDLEAAVFDSDLDLNIQTNEQILALCNKQLKSKPKSKYYLESKSLALNNLGIGLQYKGKIKESLAVFEEALLIDIELDDKKSIAASYSNLGTIYDYFGDYLKAIDCYKKSLKLQKELKNDRGISDLYNNFGVLYNTLHDYEKSLEYYFLSLKIDQKRGDKSSEAITLNNIGSLYSKKGDYPNALSYTKRAFALNSQSGNQVALGFDLGNLGSYYLDLNQLDSASYFLEQSIAIFRKQENKQKLSTFLPYYAKIQLKQGDIELARKIGEEAYALGEETGDLLSQKNAAEILYSIYKKLRKFNQSLFYFEKAESIEEKLQNDANKKQLLGFEFERKSVADSIKNQEQLKSKNTALSFAKKENQLNQERIFYLIFGLALLLALIGFVFNRFRVTKRQKQTIEVQKEEVEKQKLIIEEINHQIHDSINYSEMIQQAVLPAIEIENLFADAFLIYQPKDIVSGDFYWLEEQGDKKFFAVADCTGHGIPGAFISMIGTILLNEIYNSKKVYQPNLMMNELSRLIQLTLMTKDKKVLNDGMDLSFCVLDSESKVLQFSGANNGIYILSKNEQLLVNEQILEAKSQEGEIYLFKIDADKRPVGKHVSSENSFTLQEIQLSEGDFVLLLSDGYADQFGGPKGKKFKATQLETLLLQHYGNPAMEIKSQLLQAFTSWKGDLEQVDDVCVIGVRI